MYTRDPDEQAMRRLGSDLTAGLLDLDGFHAKATALLQRRFDCSQVVLWRVAGPGQDRRYPRLSCVVERCSLGVELDTGLLVDGREVAGYLDHLARDGMFASADLRAGATPLAQQARQLHPMCSRSALHARAAFHGRFLGIICCGRDDPSLWPAADITALKRHAAMMALYMGRFDATDSLPLDGPSHEHHD